MDKTEIEKDKTKMEKKGEKLKKKPESEMDKTEIEIDKREMDQTEIGLRQYGSNMSFIFWKFFTLPDPVHSTCGRSFLWICNFVKYNTRSILIAFY